MENTKYNTGITATGKKTIRNWQQLSCNTFSAFGIHKFLLGYTKEGIIWLVISLFTCGIVTGVLGLIEGIIYLTKSDQEFYQTYQQQKKHGFIKVSTFSRLFMLC
jgi:TM2 domain-containing membrane protein YozV